MSVDLAALRAVLDRDGRITRGDMYALIEDAETSRRVANDALDREAERMRENHDLTEKMRTMHPSVVHDCCVMVQQVRELADTIEAEIAPFTKAGDRTVVDRIRDALVVTP